MRVLRVKSLLVIKPSSLGDIVHALQVVQTLARERPDCRISWVVRERFAGLVQAAPFVHEVIIFRRRDGWREFLRLLRQLRQREFDAVWDMQGLLRSGLMTAAARAPEKWGRRDAREGSGSTLAATFSSTLTTRRFTTSGSPIPPYLPRGRGSEVRSACSCSVAATACSSASYSGMRASRRSA